jgi:RNA polymerase sigma-70 factor (ECF subfamily)
MHWQTCDRSPVQAPAAFLATTATRLAINTTQTARARHEVHVDSRHPGQGDGGLEPAVEVEQREAVESALLLLVETLSPAERAAYVLREAFQYPYQDIAEIIHATRAATRQLVSRARKRLATEPRKCIEGSACRRLLAAFLSAAQTGDFTVLEHLLAEDVISYTNRVGTSRTARVPLARRPRVVKFRRPANGQFGPEPASEAA